MNKMNNDKKMSKERKWKIATIILSVVMIAAVTTLSIFLSSTYKSRAALGNDLENMYQRAYYELIANINANEISFSKLMVTSSKSTKLQLLNDIMKSSHLAVSALSTLSAENFGVLNTTRYVNQTGDFAAYLMKQIFDDKEITTEENDILETLYEMTMEIGKQIAKINDEIDKGDYIFTERLKIDDDIFSEVFMNLEQSIVNYPSLIYDGPFSAALLDKEAKNLTGSDVTSDEGINIINELLQEFKVKDVSFTGENNSYFSMYNYDAKNEAGEDLTIQLSKKDGKLVMMNIAKTVDEPSLSPEECSVLAEQYLSDLGFSDMKSVWVSNYNSIIYVNLAPVINDVVYYPDLVKVKIASSDGELVGIDALTYIYNHTERTLPAVAISEAEARASISTKIVVETCRITLIPLMQNKEILAYEFSGHVNEAMYYIYVDVTNGDEVKILRVIDSDEGALLM